MSFGYSRLRSTDRTTVLLVGTAVALLVAPHVVGGFQTSLLAETLIFVLFATAFNLLYGYTGLLSFGHAMFVAAAGYTVAKVVSQLSPMLGIPEAFGGVSVLVTWFLALVLAVVVTTLLATLVGYLSVRLEEIYFAIITLSFSMAIYVMVLQDSIGAILSSLGLGSETFTNGSDGLTFYMGDVSMLGVVFRFVDTVYPLAYYYLILIVVAVGMYGLWRIVESPFGLVCRAVRENPERASALGVDVRFHRWMAFVLSGAFSGLAGALFIPLKTNVNPQYAHWTFSAEPVIMTVIGGPYAFFGPIVGAFTYDYLRWGISQFPLLEEYWQFSFGVLLLFVVLFFDNGVAGGINRFRAWIAVAVERYEADGAAGVSGYARETVHGYADWTVAQIRAIGARLVGGARSVAGRVSGL